MIINNLSLVNFRNYQSLDINFQKGINILSGNNGAGKTNIVEAINYLTLGKSFKTNNDEELINFNEEYLKINLEFVSKSKKTIQCIISKNSKKIIYNDYEIKRLSELNGKLISVLFTPIDVNLFKDSPSLRRRFLNIYISSFDNTYLKQLSIFNNLLKERNALLKSERIDRNYLEILDDKVIETSYPIMIKRKEIIKKLNLSINTIFQNIDSSSNEISLIYKTDLDLDNYQEYKETMKRQYKDDLQSDIRRKATSRGIHHDDMIMLLNGREIALYGSQGQNRIGSLSLKLTMIELIKKEIDEDPIIILDDVLSELDIQHQTKLLEILNNYEQVFITCADNSLLVDNASIYKIENGKLIGR
jgi:DNA replication and repair protein RecF